MLAPGAAGLSVVAGPSAAGLSVVDGSGSAGLSVEPTGEPEPEVNEAAGAILDYWDQYPARGTWTNVRVIPWKEPAVPEESAGRSEPDRSSLVRVTQVERVNGLLDVVRDDRRDPSSARKFVNHQETWSGAAWFRRRGAYAESEKPRRHLRGKTPAVAR